MKHKHTTPDWEIIRLIAAASMLLEAAKEAVQLIGLDTAKRRAVSAQLEAAIKIAVGHGYTIGKTNR